MITAVKRSVEFAMRLFDETLACSFPASDAPSSFRIPTTIIPPVDF